MELGIKELGITLMVGAFTILGFEAILHYFFNKGPIGFFKGKLGLGAEEQRLMPKAPDTKLTSSGKDKDEREQTMTVVVFVVLAFALGIIAEDLSYRYVDSENIPFKTIPARILPDYLIQKFDLPSEDDDRVTTLLESFKKPKPNPLALDLASSGAFLISDRSKNGAKVQQWILNEPRCTPGTGGDDCPTANQIEGSIKSLFYYAKNIVYEHPNHYDELRRIQSRLEFARSLSMIAFLYFLIAFTIGTPLFTKHLLERKKSRKPKSRLQELRGKIPIVVGILFCVYFVSIWAFARESDAFNRRAFGYFSTMLISEERQRALKKDLPTTGAQAR